MLVRLVESITHCSTITESISLSPFFQCIIIRSIPSTRATPLLLPLPLPLPRSSSGNTLRDTSVLMVLSAVVTTSAISKNTGINIVIVIAVHPFHLAVCRIAFMKLLPRRLSGSGWQYSQVGFYGYVEKAVRMWSVSRRWGGVAQSSEWRRCHTGRYTGGI